MIIEFHEVHVDGQAVPYHLSHIGVVVVVGIFNTKFDFSILTRLNVSQGSAEPCLCINGGAVLVPMEALEGSIEVEDGFSIELHAITVHGSVVLCWHAGLVRVKCFFLHDESLV